MRRITRFKLDSKQTRKSGILGRMNSGRFSAAGVSLLLALALSASILPASLAAAGGGDAAADAYQNGPGSAPAAVPAPDGPPFEAPAAASEAEYADAPINPIPAALAIVPLAADVTPPQLFNLSPPDGSVTGSTVTLSASYSDPEPSSGINTGTAMIHVDNRHQFGCTISGSGISCLKTGLTEGSHKIEAFICDTVYNCSVSHWYINVDATAPVISGAQPSGTINSGSSSITAVFDDGAGSGIDPATAAVTLDGGGVTGGCALSAAGIECPVSGLADGIHSAAVEVSDLAGNRGSKVWSFTVDTSAVGVTGQQPAAGSWQTSAAPPISAAFLPAAFGAIDPDTVEVMLDGEDVSGWADCHGAGVSLAPAAPLADGWHIVSVNIRDDAGHTGFSQWSFGIDTITPQIGDQRPAGPASSRPSISAAVFDGGSGLDPGSLSVALDGLNLTDAAVLADGRITVTPPDALAPGVHGVQLAIGDVAGNRQTSTWNFTVPQPAASPGVPASAPTGGQTVTGYWWIDYGTLPETGTGGWQISGFTAFPSTWYLPWHEGGTAGGDLAEEIVLRNGGAGEAVVSILVAGESRWQGKVAEGATETVHLPGASGGPVKIVCATGQPLDVRHRLARGGGVSETAALPEDALENILLLPWYENPAAGRGTAELVIANAGGQDAEVDLFVGDPAQPESLKGHYTIKASSAARTASIDASGGPVRLVCTNGQPLVSGLITNGVGATQETLATGFSLQSDRHQLEMATPQTNRGTGIHISNGNDRDLRVEVKVAGKPVDAPGADSEGLFLIPRHGAITVDVDAGTSGPLEVLCTDCGLAEGVLVGLPFSLPL